MADATVTNTQYVRGTYTLNVNYNNNGGGTVPANQTKSVQTIDSTVTVGMTLTETAPTRTNYNFLGYATSASGSVAYQPGGSISHKFTRTTTYLGQTSTTSGGVTYITKKYKCNDQTKTITLYAIWESAGSTVTATNTTIGTASTITITANDPSYTHTLRYEIGSLTGTIATGVSISYSWTPLANLGAAFPNSMSGICTIYCDTYDGADYIGTTSTTCTITAISAMRCKATAMSIADTETTVANKFHAPVRTKSRVSFTATITQGSGSPCYGATVASYNLSVNGETLTSNGAVTGYIQNTTNPYTLTITDTRGFTDTWSTHFNALDYTSPTISETSERNPSDDTEIIISYTWAISNCNNLNDKDINISYGIVGDPLTTINVPPATYSGTDTYTLTGINSADAYYIEVSVTDFFTTVTASQTIPAVGERIMHISAADNSIAFHGANPEDGNDHEFFDIEFHGNVIGGGLVKSVLDQLPDANGNVVTAQYVGSLSTGGNVSFADADKYTFYAARNSTGYRWFGIHPNSSTSIYMFGYFCNTSYMYSVIVALTISSGKISEPSSTTTYRGASYQSANNVDIGSLYAIC